MVFVARLLLSNFLLSHKKIVLNFVPINSTCILNIIPFLRPNQNFLFHLRNKRSIPLLTKMKINSSEFYNIFTPELNMLLKIFEKYHFEIRIAGGAVRDILLGKIPTDIDFATTATPEEMKNMFVQEHIRMINANGEKHGTITARINNQNFEVTTLRIDVRTDGRHAEVKFTTDWQLDSNRRDLTINSMFLGPDGTVYDYFDGYNDLLNRKILFVGDPALRIQEDYLRILRYFRFYGRICETEDDHDAATIEAIKNNVEGLGNISGERIWTEVSKILTGRYSYSLMKLLIETGAGKYFGLPVNPNFLEFKTVCERGKGLEMKPMTFLTSLLNTQDELLSFHKRCKLSNAEKNLSLLLIEHRKFDHPVKVYQKLMLMPRSVVVTRDQICELFKYRGDLDKLQEFQSWGTPKFPLDGHKITSVLGIPSGQYLGPLINKLKIHWIETNFELNEEDLIKAIPTFAKQLNISIKV